MKLFLSVLFLHICFITSAQNFTGKVVDESGMSIPSASLYIKENKQGLICNENGSFQLTLPQGKYHCEIRCIGYETDSLQFDITDSKVNYFEIKLNSKAFILKEVEIINKEDPAYAIMRKAIEKAPFHQAKVQHYHSEVYLKGSGKLSNVPKLLESMDESKSLKIIKNNLLLQESFNEIIFDFPDKYEQKVLAFSSTIPDNFDPKDVMGSITASLYNPMFGELMSPLHPKSFSRYAFRYEGFDEMNGKTVNKIKIIPKLKDPLLMSGYLYIIDETWEISHAAIEIDIYGGHRSIDITYSEVLPEIFLPTSYSIYVEVSFMGIKGFFDYLSSIKYKEIRITDQQVANKNEKDRKKKSLEIKRNDKYKIDSDSSATARDSLFWEKIRISPLNQEEISSYHRKDSLQSQIDSIKNIKANTHFKPTDIFMGGRIGGDSTKAYLEYKGLIRSVPEYNFVDGFWIGQDLKFGVRRNKNSSWEINPSVYWATAREKVVWKVRSSYSYAPFRLGKLNFSFGSYTEDFEQKDGVIRIGNSLSSLFIGWNESKLYENNFFRVSNKIDICSGLNMEAGIEFGKRNQMYNHTTFHFLKSDEKVESNRPYYPGALNSGYSGLNSYFVNLEYTPEYYYRITQTGKKEYVKSIYPTFGIHYEQGTSGLVDNASRFTRLEGSIRQSIRTGLFDRFSYTVRGGGFFDSNAFNYIDYKHFNVAPLFLTFKTLEEVYLLLPHYEFSTNKNWIQVFANYDTQYLLLKRLPFLQGKLFSEALHVKFLHTPEKELYTEWGYSLKVPILGAVGVFTSFDSFRYEAIGLRISFTLLDL